jgi:8-oxo-dGTP diphosphatase
VAVEPLTVLGERVHPTTGRHLVYTACRVRGGAARPASPREVAEVVWAGRDGLRHLAPGGVYKPVQEYLDTRLQS